MPSWSRVPDEVFVAAGAALFAWMLFPVALERWCADHPPIPAAVATQRLDDETTVARDLGFAPDTETTIRGAEPAVVHVELAPGDCIAGVASLAGSGVLESLVIEPAGSTRIGDELAGHVTVRGVVAHAEWCTDRAIALDVTVSRRELGSGSATTVRVLRAPAALGLNAIDLVRGRVLPRPERVLGPAPT